MLDISHFRTVYNCFLNYSILLFIINIITVEKLDAVIILLYTRLTIARNNAKNGLARSFV